MEIEKTFLTSKVDRKIYPDIHLKEGEMYIGYLTINLMNKMEMKTIRYIDNPKDTTDKLYELGWYPTFVKIWEWKSKTKGKPQRHKLQ